MAYIALTTAEDVQGYFNNIRFSAATTVSLRQVEMWIDQGTAILYSYVGQRYNLPITDENDILILKGIVERYVVEHVNYILVRNGKIAVEDGKMPVSVELGGFYSECKSIANGTLVLFSTQKDANWLGFNDMSDSETFTKTFKKGETQW
jgi:hypothetical protein